MKNGSFHALQRLVALATTSALLFNVVGCGLHNSKPTYSRFLEDEGGDDDGGDEGADSDSATESPHVTANDVNSVDRHGNSVQFGGTSRIEGKTTFAEWSDVSPQSDGSVKAPGSGVTNHAQEPVSAGTSPSSEGSPFEGSSKPGSSNPGSVPRVNGHDEGGGNSVPEERRVYPSSKEFEVEVRNDRELLERELGVTSAASQEKIQEAEKAVAKAIETHNAEVDKALAAVPSWETLVNAGAKPSGFKTASTSPTGQALRNANLSIQYTKATVPGAPADVLQMAEQTLAAADEAAANGNLNDAEARRQAAWDLVNAARCPSCLPQSPEKGSYDLQPSASEQSEKSKSFAASKDLYNAANDLDKNGFPGFANDARKAAAKLLNISLGLARVVNIIDLPLNILEAFAQKTIEFDESGSPQIVEASGIEIAFALGTLAFVAAGAVTVGWQAALGAGIIAGLGKTVEKGMVKHAAEKAALEIAEKGAVGVEKEALEQAAKEALEQAAKEAAEAEAKEFSNEAVNEASDLASSTEKSSHFPIELKNSVSDSIGPGYSSIARESVQIKDTTLAEHLNAIEPGKWEKVYEAGIKDGKKIEVHFFENISNGKVFDVKIKYEYWHQRAFKKITE